MKVLFLTTFNVPVSGEHFFTLEVIASLLKYGYSHPDFKLEVVSIIVTADDQPKMQEKCWEGIKYKVWAITRKDKLNEYIEDFKALYRFFRPDVIHSQMIEGIDVIAAREMNIPIVLTMHIGGLICPRGGGNGFLTNKGTICDRVVGGGCKKCMLKDFPFPNIASSLIGLLNITGLRNKFAVKTPPVYYLSPISRIEEKIVERKSLIETFNYAHIIAANKKLVEILRRNGLNDRVHLIPHGVKRRERLPMPSVDSGPVKFYFLGRVQYSKGLHNAIKAFNGIDKRLYEFHIIGNISDESRRERHYMRYVKKLAKGKNVYFHGGVPNNVIEGIIKNCHIMIHSAIYLEIYGIAIAESLSLGRPVIATRCGGAEMQVVDGYNGVLVEPNDVEALNKAIVSLINNRQIIIEYSNNCTLPHRIDEYVDSIVKLYENVCVNRV